MYHKTFCVCVDALEKMAAKINGWFPSTKMDYTKINVLIFCVIWPLITLGLVATIVAMIANPDIAVQAAKLLGLQ
jgi:hypothetical protein